MADMKATFGLDDREFRRGMDALTAYSGQASRRMEGGFGGVGRGMKALDSLGKMTGMGGGIGQVTRMAGAMGGMGVAAAGLGLYIRNATNNIGDFTAINREGAAVMDVMAAKAERGAYSWGKLGVEFKKSTEGLKEWLGLTLMGEAAQKSHDAAFRRDKTAELDRDAVRRMDEGTFQGRLGAIEDDHKKKMAELEAQFKAGNLAPTDYRRLRDSERSTYGGRMDKAIQEENERMARERERAEAEKQRQRDEDERARKEARNAAQKAADTRFSLDMDEQQRQAQVLRLSGHDAEADALERKIQMMQKIREIETDGSLSDAEKAGRIGTLQKQWTQIQALIDENARNAPGAYTRTRTLGAGLGRELARQVFGSGASDSPVAEQKKTNVLAKEIRDGVNRLIQTVGGINVRWA